MNGLVAITPWLAHYIIVVMMLLFVGIVLLTYWPSRRADIERRGDIPFRDDL